MEDKQFFANAGNDEIANAPNQSKRKRLIGALRDSDPSLYKRYLDVRRQSDGTNHLLRGGRYPLTSSGKINTYAIFAEAMRSIAAPSGSSALISPTGLATDKPTAPFFFDTLSNGRLWSFYDFENEAKVFADIDHKVRFAVTVMLGTSRRVDRSRFAFLIRHMSDISSKRFELTPNEILSLNPNTGTLPVFRARRDADITLGVYSRQPILVRESSNENPWSLSFGIIFNMAQDSELFEAEEDLGSAEFDGWAFHKSGTELVPVYEAKMLAHFDCRSGTYKGATQAQLNVGTLPRLTDAEHDNPRLEPLARYWVDRTKVVSTIADKWDQNWLLGWRRITKSEQMRTFIPTVFPFAAAGDSLFLAFPANPNHVPLLHATWSSMAFDYVARQKLSGLNMNFFIVKQLACPPPEVFQASTPWCEGKLEEWVTRYVLELSYTSWRLKDYAEDIGDDGPPFHWEPDRRARLRADLDAGFLHVYDLDRQEAEHVLDSFVVVRKYEERDYGEYRTKRLVLDAYDRMAKAMANGGRGWEPLADPPAGQGPRHAQRRTRSQ